MRPIARALVLVSALTCASPLLAENLVVSDLKAFTAKMDAAALNCDVDTVVDRIAELAVISGTGFAQGDMRMFRMNKAQYREMLTRACAVTSSKTYDRTNEKISIDGDQAFITADVAETMVIGDRQISSRVREKAVVEVIDGKLMLVQLVANFVD